MNVNIVVAGREYDLAQAIPEQLTLPERASLDDALQALAQLLPPDRQLPASCLLAVSGKHLGTLGSHQPAPLADGDELLLLAPVAGG
ncbi:MAG: MoaD/ThiS family protein [Thermoguttaceae bacterium]|jgi:molybdopterin converting factor small subunit